jgi:DNA-binding XRE family transcriptional regulator
LTIKGERYIAIPEADYTRLTGGDEDELAGSVEAGPFMANAIGDSLRAAREHAGLTQAELAKKLRKTQPMVSGAETGAVHVGERYVLAVLKACGLPADWKAPRARPQSARRSTGVKPRSSAHAWPRRAAG